jgi:hypothetical protein
LIILDSKFARSLPPWILLDWRWVGFSLQKLAGLNRVLLNRDLSDRPLAGVAMKLPLNKRWRLDL